MSLIQQKLVKFSHDFIWWGPSCENNASRFWPWKSLLHPLPPLWPQGSNFLWFCTPTITTSNHSFHLTQKVGLKIGGGLVTVITCWCIGDAVYAVLQRFMISFSNRHLDSRVRKSKNFPDSKIFHAKYFRIKRVNCDTFLLRQKCVKLENFMYFWQMCKMSNWMES